ncbi:MAG TPA: FAD-binding protein, partial [Bryobacteraceae bacterium]|nr:FAD-binding protein [Bryobacteraceae bacterium]
MDSYLVDASGFRGTAEKLWVPSGEPELLEVLRTAARDSIPVTISGGRTGLTGGSVAQGGWVVSLEKFQRLEIATGRAIAGAGVSLEAVQSAAQRTHQFYA